MRSKFLGAGSATFGNNLANTLRLHVWARRATVKDALSALAEAAVSHISRPDIHTLTFFLDVTPLKGTRPTRIQKYV